MEENLKLRPTRIREVIMTKKTTGTAIVLYTFTKENANEEIYKEKVKRLKDLLPNDIEELEDQSTILLHSNFDTEELEARLREEYNSRLQQDESVSLISVERDNVLKCICIQHANPENEDIEKLMDDFSRETNADKLSQLAEDIVRSMHENMKQTFRKLLLDNN